VLPEGAVLRAWIDQAQALGARNLTLSGGELRTRADWLPLVRYAQARVPTTLLTNGTLWTESDLAALQSQPVRFQVSLDGASASIHGSLRRPGCFAATVATIRRLVERGWGPQVTLSVCLTRLNLADAPRLVDLAAEWGVGGVYFIRIQPRGRARQDWAELAVTTAAYSDLCERLYEKQQAFWGVLHVRGVVSDFVAASLRSPQERRCPLGQQLWVDVNGDLYPCGLLAAPPFRLNDRPGVSLAGGLAAPALQAWQEAVSRRSEQLPAWRRCDWRRFCQGACPGLAWQNRGDPHTTDDLCALRQRFYERVIFDLARLGERPTNPDATADL